MYNTNFYELQTAAMQVMDKPRLKRVRVAFPLHREGLTAYFSPILGQYAIKNIDFLTHFLEQFNLITNGVFKSALNPLDTIDEKGLYSEDELVIPMTVNVYKLGKFTLIINPPATGFLYSISFKKRRRIYKFWRNVLQPLRHYKKIFQIFYFQSTLTHFFRMYNLKVTEPLQSGIGIDSLKDSRLELTAYKQLRNSIFQTKA